MIPSQNLINKICTKISGGGLTAQETCETSNALTILALNPIVSVATFSALPSVSLYEGRMIYVTDENRYYYSTGSYWIKDFTSTNSVYAGEAWDWGCNNNGQLGDGTSVNKSSPVSTVDEFTDWCQVSAGTAHSLGVRTNGTAWAWGCNIVGRLGDGTTIAKSSPVSIVGGFTDWCQVNGGYRHSLGIRTNGTAWAWGTNSTGELGDGTTVDKSSPVSVVGGFINWCQISAGTTHNVGVRTNGTAWAWGFNTSGQLGDGTTVDKSSPVLVVGGFVDWCQVSAGAAFGQSLGVRTNGTAWAWGANQYTIVSACPTGALGDGTTISKCSPVLVVGGFTDWCQVSVGTNFSLGLRTNGTTWAWGCNNCGQLADGTNVGKSSPISVVGGFTDWCQVDAGACHSLGVRTNGTAWAWGVGGNGRLGDGTAVNKSSPVSVVGGFTDWSQVSAGCGHSLGLRALRKGF